MGMCQLALFAGFVNRFVNVFKLTARGIIDDLRPGFIGFSQSNRIGVTRATILAESLFKFFSDMWTAHDDRHSDGANCIGHAVGLRDHSSHRANANQPNLLVEHELCDLRFVHGLGVAVNKDDFMSGRSERLQKEHPQVWHEITRDTVVGVVEQDSHECPF